jgi:hypothetical protein
MRGFRAKLLMKLTRWERAEEKDVVERGLVQKKSGSWVNVPKSIRAMYLQLKNAFRRKVSDPTHPDQLRKLEKKRAELEAKGLIGRLMDAGRSRKRPPRAEPRDTGERVTVQRPLMLILEHNLPSQNERGEWVAHPTYVKAARAAKRGDGETVKQMAAAYA